VCENIFSAIGCVSVFHRVVMKSLSHAFQSDGRNNLVPKGGLTGWRKHNRLTDEQWNLVRVVEGVYSNRCIE
jgi:hypothetical protein